MSAPKRRPLAILCLLACICGGCSPILWRSDLESSIKKAHNEDKVVIVWYWQPFNEECIRMDRTVFRSKHVVNQMRETVPVRINATFNEDWGQAMGISTVPAFAAFGPEGDILRVRNGPMNTDQFLGFLVASKLSK